MFMNIPSHIFKSYDIRGLVESELSEELFYRIGRAAVIHTGARHVFVGYDMRPSSIPFAQALILGVTEQGADATDIGLISTPMLNIMTIRDREADLGAMITASHNPQEYNGCKFVNKKTMMPIGLASGLSEMRAEILKNDFPSGGRRGGAGKKDVSAAYVDFLYSLIDARGILPVSVVFDFGNGIEGAIIDRIVERLPIRPVYLYKEPDGRFPNHEANPLKHETLRELQKTIVREGAAFGLAYDGDADRVGLADETGAIIPGDLMMALLVPDMLRRFPGAPMLYDLRSSKIVKETIEAHGGVAVESRVGRTLIIEEMRKRNAAFGGELSCHFYFHDLYGFESGDLFLLSVLKLLSESGKNLSELVAPLRKYHHSGEINFEVEDKTGAIRRLTERFSPGALRVSSIDGVKIEFPDWWFNVRQSNTEPLLRLNLEADTEEHMLERVSEVTKVF